jgi:hypothetical protein
MAEPVYLACAAASLLSGALLLRRRRHSRMRLIPWTCICFGGLAVNNALLFTDLALVPVASLAVRRHVAVLGSVVAVEVR